MKIFSLQATRGKHCNNEIILMLLGILDMTLKKKNNIRFHGGRVSQSPHPH